MNGAGSAYCAQNIRHYLKIVGYKLNSVRDNFTYLVLAFAVVALLFSSCGSNNKKEGKKAADGEETGLYDLEEIRESGELIAVTISGPETYYEYKGRRLGLQYALAEDFSHAEGMRLRIEAVRDTMELFRRVRTGAADIGAVEFPAGAEERSGVSYACFDSVAEKNVWVVREDAKELYAALNNWYKNETRARLAARERKLFSNTAGKAKRKGRAPMQNRKAGVISPYDALFMRHCRTAGWDWRLMAAQCRQESGFDADARSWTGAAGLMQLMPETAARYGLSAPQVDDPEKNIGAAARFIAALDRSFSDIKDRSERIRFVLAAYNGGAGHIRDAMALCRKYGKDSGRWTDVSTFVLRLSEANYYNDAAVNFGYMRGAETCAYVEDVISAWEYYKSAAPAGDVLPPSAKKKRNRK